MAELTYALNREGRLVHVDSVPNGLACGCRCPGCGAPLVAKNNGETVVAHFAHASGVSCAGAQESELHLLAKEVISEAKAVMLPLYGNVYGGGVVKFDEVEVEERNDVKSLQPDICGVVHRKDGTDSRLWIEIRVTHAIGPEKRTLIQRNGIACVEINLGRLIGVERTKEQVRMFLLEDKADREWTNNPVLEKKRMESADRKRSCAIDSKENKRLEQMSAWEAGEEIKRIEKAYLEEHKDCCVVGNKGCYECKHHTTRAALFEECKRQHFPAWVREALSCNLLYWTKDNIKYTVKPCINRTDNIQNGYYVEHEHFFHLLPVSSLHLSYIHRNSGASGTPDIHGKTVSQREINQNQKIIPFLMDSVPAIIASVGLKCGHCVKTFPSLSTRYDIACNMPNVVSKHRRKG